MKPNPYSLLLKSVASLALWSGSPLAEAATLYWDGTSSGTGADGGAGTWSTDPATANWDTSSSGGSSVAWTDGSDAVFGGVGGLVTLSGTVSATSLNFGAAGYSLTGGNVALAGTPVIDDGGNDVTLGSVISGSDPISKLGVGTLTLSGSNLFSGIFTITEGTLIILNSDAFGSPSKGTTVSSGATLNLNGRWLAEYERITFSGGGVGGAGAIVNNSTDSSYSVLRNGILDGPATVGGTSNWGFGIFGPTSSLNMGGHTLTKVGPADFRLNNCGVSAPGNIDLQEGSLWLENSTRLNGSAANVISVSNGATLVQTGFNLSSQVWTASFETNTIWFIQFGSSRWSGPVSLAGATTFNIPNGSSMIHTGIISGPGSISKKNFGPLTLEGLNTYTGGTFIEAGRLEAQATGLGSGPVTVAVGGTLAGNATIPNTVNIAGTLDPGLASLTWPATISTGPAILTGNYQCQLRSSFSDSIAVTGDLTITGSSLILNSTSGAFTDLDIFIIATYSGNLTGQFATVTGMPPGYDLRYDAEGKRIILIPGTYDIWLEGFPTLPDPTPDGDPDGDGIPTLVEYVLGGDPSVGDPTFLQAPELTADNLLFRYKRRDSSKETTTQVVQWSSDFDQWHDIPVTDLGSPDVSVSPNGDLPDEVTVTIPRVPGGMFVRLKIALH